MKENYKVLLKKVKAFVFDIDGVLTNNTISFGVDGQILRNMNSKDGYALQLAVKKGYKLAIISGGSAFGIKENLKALGISDLYLNSSYKLDSWEDFLAIYAEELSEENILYMGDDIPDYLVMEKAGVACCPSNAATEIKGISDYVSPLKGGEGCVRDVIEQTLKVQDNWMLEEDFSW